MTLDLRLSAMLLATLGAGCGDLCGAERLPRCDIREEACHAQVQAIVQCTRGRTASSLPSIEVISLDDFEARLRAGADPMMMRSLEWETSLGLLGLVDPRADLFESSIAGALTNVAAFYSPGDREVFVIDRGMIMNSPEAVATLAHELVHAAQDEEHDLDALLDAARTHEDVMVLKSVVEGEAELYTLEAFVWDNGGELQDLDWPRVYDPWIADIGDALGSTPSPYFGVYGTLPYVVGARWQTARWEEGGDEAVRRGITAPPESSAWLLVDPWRAGRVPPTRAPSPLCERTPAPPGFEARDPDEMGAPLVYAFLMRWGMTHAEAWDLALRWRRDDLEVYAAPDGGAAVAWRIVLGDTQAPRWIATQLETAAPDAFRAGYAGETVVILTSTDPTLTAAWTWEAPAGCAPPG